MAGLGIPRRGGKRKKALAVEAPRFEKEAGLRRILSSQHT